MSENVVKRYDLVDVNPRGYEAHHVMEERVDGDYVEYTDYLALLEENRRLVSAQGDVVISRAEYDDLVKVRRVLDDIKDRSRRGGQMIRI